MSVYIKSLYYSNDFVSDAIVSGNIISNSAFNEYQKLEKQLKVLAKWQIIKSCGGTHLEL